MPAGSTWMADPRRCPGKTGSLFPDQEPPLFFDHNAPPGQPEVPDNLQNHQFFTPKRTRLNCTVFSLLKRPVSKNNGLKRKSCSGLAPFPLEPSVIRSVPKTLRRRMEHGKGHVQPPPPFIRGSCPKSGVATRRHPIRSANIFASAIAATGFLLRVIFVLRVAGVEEFAV